MNGLYISISRKWNHPQIVTKVTDEGIELDMDIDDFKAAVLREISGSLGFLSTRVAVETKLSEAIKAVIEGVKEESAKVKNLP